VKRRRLPNDRKSITHKFTVGDQEGYLIVGLYEDGSPGELFITASKQGSTVSGLADAVAIMVSLALQYGVPLEAIIDKFKHTRYDPSGMTGNTKIPLTSSLMDYVSRWLEIKFVSNVEPVKVASGVSCPDCGALMIHEEGCLKCLCGYSKC